LARAGDVASAHQQAVEVYRALAAARSEAFRPDLARSLNNLSNRLAELGRREDALSAIEEAVRLLAPHFLVLPKAYEGWMRIVAGGYWQQANELERPIDQELLGPIVAALESLDQSGE
jgi:tetratricopeptide (TPR) repeat protein